MRTVEHLAWLTALVLVGCTFKAGEPRYIRGYRLADDRTLSVLVDTSVGVETWVQSVVETPTSVIVEVRDRMTEYGAGAPVGEDLWLTVELNAPLGNRTVVDATRDEQVFVRP